MKTEIKTITPEMAIDLLKKNQNNRRLDTKQVDFFADQMIKNEWKLTGQGISIATDGRIIDGQHRLAAIAKSKKSLPMLIISELQFKTQNVYDTGKTRTASDIFVINKIKYAIVISAGIKIYYSFLKNYKDTTQQNMLKLTNENIFNIYQKNSEIYDKIGQFAGSKEQKIIANSLVCGCCMYLIIEKNYHIEKVFDFFSQINSGMNVKNNSIIYFRNKIIQSQLNRKNITRGDLVIFLIKLWNNYIKGKEIQRFIITSDDYSINFI